MAAKTQVVRTELEKDMYRFKEDVDAWIKQIQSQVLDIKEVPSQLDENLENIQHNYELINELRHEIEELRQELKMQRLMQLIVLKQNKNN